MRMFLGLLTAFAIGIFGSAEARADNLQNIISRGVVRIAVPVDTPPFGFLGADRNPTGYDVEIAQMLAEALGVKLELEPTISSNRVPFLLTDKVDIVISNMGLTPERAKQIMFSQPYANNFSGVYGTADLPVSSADELGDYTIAASKGTMVEMALSKMSPDAKIMRTDDNPTAVMMYLSGQADLLAGEHITSKELAKQYPNSEFALKFKIRNAPVQMGVQMDQHNLLRWVDSFIFVIKGDGRLNALQMKYFGEELGDLPNL